MKTYETSGTVENQGQLHLAGVPFKPGTEVHITIRPKRRSEEVAPAANDAELAVARERMRELFQTVKGFRNSPRIPREELHERGCVH